MNALIAKPLPAAVVKQLPGGIAGSGRMLPAAGAAGGSGSSASSTAAATAGRPAVAMMRSTGAYGSEEDYGPDLAAVAGAGGGGGGGGGATAGGAKRSYGTALLAGLHERQAAGEVPEGECVYAVICALLSVWDYALGSTR